MTRKLATELDVGIPMKQQITSIALVLAVCLLAVADDGVQIVTTETLQPETMHWMANLECPEYARGGRDWRALIPYALLGGGITVGINRKMLTIHLAIF